MCFYFAVAAGGVIKTMNSYGRMNYQHTPSDTILYNGILTVKQKRQLQHEFKIHLEKYFKELIGKSSDSTKITIWEQAVICRGKGFLTEPEKFVARTPDGKKIINASRMKIFKQFAKDNQHYFEEKLRANCIYQTYTFESTMDVWIHVLIFDQLLIDIK
mgnify:CR=1 FL=1